MKKFIFTFLLFFATACLSIQAQSTWITMLPDTGYAAKMIRTNDGKFLAVSTIFDNNFLLKQNPVVSLYSINYECNY